MTTKEHVISTGASSIVISTPAGMTTYPPGSAPRRVMRVPSRRVRHCAVVALVLLAALDTCSLARSEGDFLGTGGGGAGEEISYTGCRVIKRGELHLRWRVVNDTAVDFALEAPAAGLLAPGKDIRVFPSIYDVSTARAMFLFSSEEQKAKRKTPTSRHGGTHPSLSVPTP